MQGFQKLKLSEKNGILFSPMTRIYYNTGKSICIIFKIYFSSYIDQNSFLNLFKITEKRYLKLVTEINLQFRIYGIIKLPY